ncbi:hypothetical protein Ahy_A06g027182 [Arachis hypogaea]|uniref:Uncharacterized protein n=1 Tax=Arachis hypogaea TaxID=3818 RepID=A0A445CMX0_ARAHY|nr:hypothetical protein Ahy_A06g027182 [Arachis hypogaea]
MEYGYTPLFSSVLYLSLNIAMKANATCWSNELGGGKMREHLIESVVTTGPDLEPFPAMIRLILLFYLSLTIWSQPSTCTILPNLGEAGAKFCCKDMAERHEFRGFISSITKHVTLVTSTNLLWALGKVAMDTLCNIGALLLNVDQDLAFVSIKTDIIRDKSNVAASVTDNLLIVYIGLGCYFSKHHDHVGLGAGLTGNLTIGILLEAGIENCIRDLVAELVRVTLVDRFGSKKEGLGGHLSSCTKQ